MECYLCDLGETPWPLLALMSSNYTPSLILNTQRENPLWMLNIFWVFLIFNFILKRKKKNQINQEACFKTKTGGNPHSWHSAHCHPPSRCPDHQPQVCKVSQTIQASSYCYHLTLSRLNQPDAYPDQGDALLVSQPVHWLFTGSCGLLLAESHIPVWGWNLLHRKVWFCFV